MDKSMNLNNYRLRHSFSITKLIFWSCIFLGLLLLFFLHSPLSNHADATPSVLVLLRASRSRAGGLRVLVTGAAGFVGLLLLFFLHSPLSNHADATTHRRRILRSPDWESRVVKSSTPRSRAGGLRVLVTGAAGFVGTHVSAALL
ncbi:UDP-glucuronate 4-epimerase 3 [Linum grandiflorum]